MAQQFALYTRPLGGDQPWTALVRSPDLTELFRLREDLIRRLGSTLLYDLKVTNHPFPAPEPCQFHGDGCATSECPALTGIVL